MTISLLKCSRRSARIACGTQFYSHFTVAVYLGLSYSPHSKKDCICKTQNSPPKLMGNNNRNNVVSPFLSPLLRFYFTAPP